MQRRRIGQMESSALTKVLAETIGTSTVRLALENCPELQRAPFTSMLSSH